MTHASVCVHARACEPGTARCDSSFPAGTLHAAGGQKARVVFTAISLSKPHILLLDEPTNHLDMQSIDALCDALDEFTGGVVVISHDSQLLSRLCADEERSEVRE